MASATEYAVPEPSVTHSDIILCLPVPRLPLPLLPQPRSALRTARNATRLPGAALVFVTVHTMPVSSAERASSRVLDASIIGTAAHQANVVLGPLLPAVLAPCLQDALVLDTSAEESRSVAVAASALSE